MLATILRLLTLRLTREEMLSFDRLHFFVGLLGTWAVGIGRYWDDERASLLQHLGLGSVIYIFLLAGLLWIVVLPFRIPGWTYFRVLTFVSLTSFPAIFYAIPVEQFWSMDVANTINVWFLAVVASWRLAMLYHFMRRFTQLSAVNIFTITLLPICLIITALTILNLHRVVFDIMGGRHNTGPHDASYGVLVTLTVISALLVLPLLIAYVVGIAKRRRQTGG